MQREQPCSSFQSEAGFTDPAGTRQRDKAMLLEEASNPVELSFPPDQF
jgi:hypothetical protein